MMKLLWLGGGRPDTGRLGLSPAPEGDASRAKRGREAPAGTDSKPSAKKGPTPKRRSSWEGGREAPSQNGMSSESRSSTCAGAPPAGMAEPFTGAASGWAAACAPLPFGLSRN